MTDTSFERLRRAMLRSGPVDRAPLFELSIHASIKSAILGREIVSVADEVAFWQTAGYDFVSMRAGVRSLVRGKHPVARAWREERQSRPGSGGAWVVEEDALIRDRQEFEAFPWPAAEALGGYDEYPSLDDHLARMAQVLPPDMKIVVQLGYLFMGAWQLMGFENFCLCVADDPDLVRDVVDRLAESQLAVLEHLLEYGCVGAIWWPDDLCYNSGPVVSPRAIARLVLPWYVRIVERCHQAGIPIGLHSDGDLTRLLPDLVGCGFDAIHPFEPPANDIVAVKRAWGDRIAVAGNIDLRGALSRGTPAEVEEEVRTKATVLAPGGGWLVGSSNSIPEFVPVENYRMLLAAGLKYGGSA